MKVIAQTTLVEHGNSKSVSLVEAFEMYTVITAEKTANDMCVYANPHSTCDLMEALHMYKQDGGYIPDVLKG